MSDLHGTEGVQQVGVMPNAGAEAPTLMLARFDELGDLSAVHAMELTH